MKKKPEQKHIKYYWFRKYVVFFFKLYFPHVYSINQKNVLPEGTANVMVGCHQATFIDALAPSLLLSDRRTRGLLRSDVFSIPVISWFVKKLGMYPIARLNFEGAEAMEKYNDKSLNSAADAINAGHTLIMFPEAGHQQGHYLGTLSHSFVRIAMNAAEKEGFKRDVYITPYAHHYANYYHPFYDMMVMFGEPLNLAPYYDKYNTRPRTTRRQISDEIKRRISALMLDIHDKEHYKGISYILDSAFGANFCDENGGNHTFLPDKLKSEKELVAQIENLGIEDTETITPLLLEAENIDKSIHNLGLRDWLFEFKHHLSFAIIGTLLSLILLPLAAISWLLTFPVYLLPYIVKTRRINGMVDPMFSSTCDFVGTIIFTYPIFGVLPVIPLLFYFSWYALLYPVISLLMILFVCRYQRLVVKTLGLLRYCFHKKDVENIADRRRLLFKKLRKLIKPFHLTREDDITSL